jgi:hypothetical protein
MSKVTPIARQSVIAAGTVGLAVFGVGAGAVAAHAADNATPGGLPLSTNAFPAVKNLLQNNHGTVAGVPLSGIPVVGSLPELLGGLPTGSLPMLQGLDAGGPMQRSRPHAAPMAPSAPMVMHGAMAQQATAAAPKAAPAAGATDGPLDGLTSKLPLGGLEKGVPGLSSLTGGLPLDGLAGGLPLDGLAGGLPLDSLAGGLV